MKNRIWQDYGVGLQINLYMKRVTRNRATPPRSKPGCACRLSTKEKSSIIGKFHDPSTRTVQQCSDCACRIHYQLRDFRSLLIKTVIMYYVGIARKVMLSIEFHQLIIYYDVMGKLFIAQWSDVDVEILRGPPTILRYQTLAFALRFLLRLARHIGMSARVSIMWPCTKAEVKPN